MTAPSAAPACRGGVTAALLRAEGVRVFNETQLDAAARYLATLEGAPG